MTKASIGLRKCISIYSTKFNNEFQIIHFKINIYNLGFYIKLSNIPWAHVCCALLLHYLVGVSKHAQNARIHIILQWQSLSRPFALHWNIPWYPMMFADSKVPDQTTRMRSLTWAFAVRIYPKTRFCMVQPICCRTSRQTTKYIIYLLNIWL